MNHFKACLCLLALAASTACGRVPPLAHTHPSASSLAAAVLDALARKDRATLEALTLSETEFRDHVWPQLPAARPERNVPFSYVWGDLRQKSTMALTGVLSRDGGKRYELIDVRFDAVTDYRTYRVHRETTMRVKDPAGIDIDMRVCGSMIEQDGAWKVFSYVIAD